MLSRVANTRAGAFGSLLGSNKQWRLVLAAVKARNASDKPSAENVPKPACGSGEQDSLEIWKAAEANYYSPQRDTVNFPDKICPETHPPVRLGFIPDSWFQAFYNKTGVTGPYMFGVGLTTYLLSKEIWIVEHNFNHFIAFWLMWWFVQRKYGAKIAEYLDNERDTLLESKWYSRKAKAKKDFEEGIKECEQFIWQQDGQKYLFEAKRENVDLQLESEYRQRLNEAYREVKKRLDYQVEVLAANRRIQQQHMVQWIVDGVMAGITPQQEKDSLSKCLTDLKTLSSKAAVA